MDISREYVKMCIAARELQLMRPDYWEEGDFYYAGANIDGNNDSISIVCVANYTDNGQKERRESYEVWLPRLDQLAQLHENWNHKYSFCFFAEMDTNSKFYPIVLTNLNGAQLSFDSLEKHMLCHYMWYRYSKIWDIAKQVWYTQVERITPEQIVEAQKFFDNYKPEQETI